MPLLGRYLWKVALKHYNQACPLSLWWANQNTVPWNQESLWSNPATQEEAVIQLRTVDRDLTPLIGLNDSQILKLIELLRGNIAFTVPAKPSVRASAAEVLTPLTMETILINYSDVSDVSIGKLEGGLHLYTRDDIPSLKTAPREIPLSVKSNFIA